MCLSVPWPRSDSRIVRPGCERFPSWRAVDSSAELSCRRLHCCPLFSRCVSPKSALTSFLWAERSVGVMRKNAASRMTFVAAQHLCQPIGAPRFDAVERRMVPHHPLTSACPEHAETISALFWCSAGPGIYSYIVRCLKHPKKTTISVKKKG